MPYARPTHRKTPSLDGPPDQPWDIRPRSLDSGFWAVELRGFRALVSTGAAHHHLMAIDRAPAWIGLGKAPLAVLHGARGRP